MMSVAGHLGTAVKTGGRSDRERRIDAEDALWLARALMGEGGRSARAERLALAATMVRGWMLSGRARFADWLRGFSQPINPRWLPGADLWNQHAARVAAGNGHASLVSDAAAARRVHFQSLPWSEIPADVRADVIGIVTGSLPLELDGFGPASNFGGPVLYRSYGLKTSSLADRRRTAPAAVQSRESRRGVAGPRYEHAPGSGPGGNVFHSTAEGRASTFKVEPGPDAGALGPGATDPGGKPFPVIAAGALVCAVALVGVL